MYRFLATPRWLGLAALALALATIMVGLGDWQLHRYRERSAINARIDASATATPVPLDAALAGAAWTRVRVTGEYDPAHEILARERTVDASVGYEVLTPLVLPDGTAVIVDRGWLAPPPGGALTPPVVPPAPTGAVTVVGRVRLPESRATAPVPSAGRLQVRRISPGRLAAAVPYRLYGSYLTLDEQSPPADRRFIAIPVDHQNALQNGGYVVQWWAFAALTLFGYGYLARRNAKDLADARSEETGSDTRVDMLH